MHSAQFLHDRSSVLAALQSERHPRTRGLVATVISTPRLELRTWRDEDLPAFAALNADPEVMEHFPSVLTAAESDRLARLIQDAMGRNGFGLWAAEVIGGAPFIGFVGLEVPSFEAHFTPAVEVGWRLAREHWGQGHATEAARACLSYGFTQAALDEIVSFTVPTNTASRRVMEKIGMTRDPKDDFDHPRLPRGHRLSRHVLYRIGVERWRAGAGAPAARAQPMRDC